MKKINVDKDKIIFDYKKGNSLTFLKNKYSLDKRTLKKFLLEANCYIDPYKKNINDIEISDIISDYNNRVSVENLCKKYLIGRRRINKLLLDNGVINHGNCKFDYNRKIFENIDDEKKAYWLGFIYADGSVYKSKDNVSHHLTIKLSSKDISHLDKFKKDFNLPHDIKLRKENGFSGGFESARIRLVSKDIVNNLISHGCVPNKTFILQFPNIDKSLYNHFIRGYFDGDGSISITNEQRQITILGNYDFLYRLQEILIENCGVNKTKITKKDKIYYLHYGGNLSIKKIGEFLYNKSTTYMDRKYKLFY